VATTTFVLVRHGETDWNRERRFQGHADVPLNEAGRRQAEALADALAGERFAAAYSSPLRRALETAEIVADRLHIPVEPRAGLMEVDVGSWSGLTTAEVEQRFPDGFRHWVETRADGWTDGETYEELGARVIWDLRRLAERHPGESVLAVTHGGPIRSVLAAAAGLSFTSGRAAIGFVENCAVVRVAVREGEIEAAD
jgi:broad specificity phosphatase PhoE